MEALLTLSKVLIDLSVALLKKKGEDRTRQRLADLLCQVGDCVLKIGENIQAKRHSAELCGELNVYVGLLDQLVAEETNEETARQLTFWLKNVAEAPGFSRVDLGAVIESEVRPRWTDHHRFEQSQQVKEIGGIIRGVGNLIRV